MAAVAVEQDRKWSACTYSYLSGPAKNVKIELVLDRTTPMSADVVRKVGVSASGLLPDQIHAKTALNRTELHISIQNRMVEVTLHNSIAMPVPHVRPISGTAKEEGKVRWKLAGGLIAKYRILSVIGLSCALVSLISIYAYPVVDPGLARIFLPFALALLGMVTIDYLLNGRNENVKC